MNIIRNIPETIKKSFNATIYKSIDVDFFLTIPLDEKGFKQWDRKKSDFLSIFFSQWDNYKEDVVIPIIASCSEIRKKTQAMITINGSFDSFKSLVVSKKFKVIILFGHHVLSEKDIDRIQFYDKQIDYNKIKEFLLSVKLVNTTILHIICNTKNEFEVLYRTHPGIEYIGFSLFKVPVEEGIIYVKYLIENMENKTLMDAHNDAVSKISKLYSHE